MQNSRIELLNIWIPIIWLVLLFIQIDHKNQMRSSWLLRCPQTIEYWWYLFTVFFPLIFLYLELFVCWVNCQQEICNVWSIHVCFTCVLNWCTFLLIWTEFKGSLEGFFCQKTRIAYSVPTGVTLGAAIIGSVTSERSEAGWLHKKYCHWCDLHYCFICMKIKISDELVKLAYCSLLWISRWIFCCIQNRR